MSSIKVCVRVRPLSDARKEKWAAGFDIHGRRLTLGTKTYDPDVTLRAESTQDDVFGYALPILDAVKDGNNGTILVYGQTGTGKTHTMIGGDGQFDGITIKAIEYLLDYVRDETLRGKQVALALSVLEIYNERITDMLSDNAAEILLVNGFPRHTTSATLSSLDEAVATVQRALHGRHVSETAMNDRSSRSHVIFMLDLIEKTETSTDISHLFLVDLAGSESIKKSQVVGKAALEAGMINKSLLALKNVILTLSSSTNQDPAARGHVPYRDSRLTELLQDSIGGTARTMFIACVSPNGRDIDETKSTLDYATKARSIRNVSNTERDKLQIKCRGLEMEVLKLKNRLERQAERGGYTVTKDEHDQILADAEQLKELKDSVALLQRDNKEAKAHTQVTNSQIAIFRESMLAKDAELQQCKAALAGAVQHMHIAAASLDATLTRCVDAAKGAVEEDHRAHDEQLAAIVAALDNAQHVANVPLERLRTMWQHVNARHADAVARVAVAMDEMGAAVLEEHQRGARAANGAMQQALAALQSAVRDVETTMAGASSNIRGAVAQGKDFAARVRAQPLDLTDADTPRHVAEDVSRAARDLVAQAVKPQMSDASRAAFSKWRGAVRAAVNGMTCDAFAAVSSIDLPPVLARPTLPLPPPAPSTAAPAADDDDAATTCDEPRRAPSVAGARSAAEHPPRASDATTASSTQMMTVRRTPLAHRSGAADNNSGPKRSRSNITDAALDAQRRRPVASSTFGTGR